MNTSQSPTNIPSSPIKPTTLKILSPSVASIAVQVPIDTYIENNFCEQKKSPIDNKSSYITYSRNTLSGPGNSPLIPSFNHIPVTPSCVPPNMSLEDKEKSRLEKQRLRTAKYNQKIKAYKKIALLDSNLEKIKGILLICYPELSKMNAIELNLRVERIIQSLNQPLIK